MKLSIVIICWNDWKVIENCLRSIFEGTHKIEYEVIVSDNGSTDGSVELISSNFPAVHLVENGANLGFAKGNNAGIRKAAGEYVLILNPDTIVHDSSLDRWIEFAEIHPEAGAFGCRVENPDGSYQISARPFHSIRGSLLAALYLHSLAHLGGPFITDTYPGWSGDSEREVDWQSGCCVMFRGALLQLIGGFDEQFFYHFEEQDLCRRVWKAGYAIRFMPKASITHLGGQSVGRFPIRFAIETCRNGYRYFYKHFGEKGAVRFRQILLIRYRLRKIGYGLANFLSPNEARTRRLELYRSLIEWNKLVDPVIFVKQNREPQMKRVAAC